MTGAAFKQVYFSLHPKLYRIAFTILKNAEDAEDVLQNMYIKIWMAREKLATVQNPEAYCITALKNSCLDILRSQRVLCNDNNIEGYDYPDQITNAETEIVYKETIKRIKSIIHRLPAKQQRIIDLRVFCDCSSEEIEQITGESSENVRVLLSRARNTLRMKLKR